MKWGCQAGDGTIWSSSCLRLIWLWRIALTGFRCFLGVLVCRCFVCWRGLCTTDVLAWGLLNTIDRRSLHAGPALQVCAWQLAQCPSWVATAGLVNYAHAAKLVHSNASSAFVAGWHQLACSSLVAAIFSTANDGSHGFCRSKLGTSATGASFLRAKAA